MRNLLDHVGLPVSDLPNSRGFYVAALTPLGVTLQREYEGMAAGFGDHEGPQFWIAPGATGASVHVCFRAANRAAVDAFYAAAIAAGGRDNGAPGLRTMYHPNYYGAFVLDPDGHNVEAVTHLPEG